MLFERIVVFTFISLAPFATMCKKKGVKPLCCYTSVSPNTCTLTTAKPTPEGVSIRFLLLKCTLKLAISGVHQAEANTSFMSLCPYFYCLCHTYFFKNRDKVKKKSLKSHHFPSKNFAPYNFCRYFKFGDGIFYYVSIYCCPIKTPD